jgi:TfoX/Sxy family transcriptional regulator of competence genes
MPKPSSEAVDRFKQAVPHDAAVTLRPMFGNLAAFANGYLFAGLFGDDVFVRADDDAQARIMGEGGTAFAPMPGRPMRAYVMLPTAWRTETPRLADESRLALVHTMGLPPKEPKPKKPKSTKP